MSASLAALQEAPTGSLILLTGAPGAGKSTWCLQLALRSLAGGRPVMFVTTERRPAEIRRLLEEGGMKESAAAKLSFVDASPETAGPKAAERPDTIRGHCADLNSISIAITKLQERTGRKNLLLVLDSLTSLYLFCGAEVVRFLRLFLSKVAAEGNSVVACMDEGCSKPEDFGAMMSVVEGIIRLEVRDGSRAINVVKHPTLRPGRIELPPEAEVPSALAEGERGRPGIARAPRRPRRLSARILAPALGALLLLIVVGFLARGALGGGKSPPGTPTPVAVVAPGSTPTSELAAKASPLAAAQEEKSPNLVIKVTDEAGVPLKGVEVALRDDTMASKLIPGIDPVTTDWEGMASFLVPAGVYKIVLNGNPRWWEDYENPAPTRTSVTADSTAFLQIFVLSK